MPNDAMHPNVWVYTTLEFPSYTLELVITLNIPSSLELRYSSGFHSYCITMGHILEILFFSALMWKTTQDHRASDQFSNFQTLCFETAPFDIPDDPKKSIRIWKGVVDDLITFELVKTQKFRHVFTVTKSQGTLASRAASSSAAFDIHKKSRILTLFFLETFSRLILVSFRTFLS